MPTVQPVAVSNEAMQSVQQQSDIVLLHKVNMSSVIVDKSQGLKVTAKLTLLEFQLNKITALIYRMSSKFCSRFQNLLHDNQNGNTKYLANYFLTKICRVL